ncbi:ATP-dependent DNA helicase PIF1-like [Cardiocondyla obscurior]|uniref:ATP-dependent DNA helicase PIF1-like n=1 Tax=Cardiocondyla obscurior TaxID=286306 RepID=UPI003965842A
MESMSLYEFAQWYDITTIEPMNNIPKYYKIDSKHFLKRRRCACLINHYKYNVETQSEDYFFSLLLMFKPWRNLDDLKNNCDTYAEAFEKAKQLVQQVDEELQQKNVSQDDPDNPIGIQNIEAGEAMQDFRDLGDVKLQDVTIAKLNADQLRVFNRVIDTVKSEDSILRLYVSEEGGTGKSFLIKTIKCWIKHNLNKDTALAAPTGIAAFNIDGLTVYRLLQLPVEHEIFDTNDVEDGWFGKKHILLFGDLLQLPPVREDCIFAQLSNDKFNKCIGFLTAINLWFTLFHYDELTINMRQREDDTYRQLLSRIRIGTLTTTDRVVLENRKIIFKGDSLESRLKEVCDFINNCSSDAVCLLPALHMCDALNTAMLSRIDSKEILLIAEDTIDCTLYLKKKVLKVLSNNDDDNSKTAGLSKEIVIKIGAKVMIRRNIDATLGLVNGTIATVVSVVRDISTDCVEKIKLLLPSGLEYLIERVNVKFEVVDKAFVTAVIDVGNSIFNFGQSYVALSRVTTVERLHLINFDPSKVTAHEKAIDEYNRLRYKYKPEAEIITMQKEHRTKVKDILWIQSNKLVEAVQENGQQN